MRTALALLAVPALLFGSVAAADDEFLPCEADDDVVASGESMTFNPTGEEVFTFKVDPTTAAKGRITVDATLTWDTVVNDWDLGINGTLSEGFQPLDEAIESVSHTARGDCKTVMVEVINFNAVEPLELGMTLEVSVR